MDGGGTPVQITGLTTSSPPRRPNWSVPNDRAMWPLLELVGAHDVVRCATLRTPGGARLTAPRGHATGAFVQGHGNIGNHDMDLAMTETLRCAAVVDIDLECCHGGPPYACDPPGKHQGRCFWPIRLKEGGACTHVYDDGDVCGQIPQVGIHREGAPYTEAHPHQSGYEHVDLEGRCEACDHTRVDSEGGIVEENHFMSMAGYEVCIECMPVESDQWWADLDETGDHAWKHPFTPPVVDRGHTPEVAP